MKRLLALLCCGLLAADGWAADPQDASALNVSIAVFDPGVPDDLAMQRDLGIFPRIREIEAKYLPFVLRQVLVRSGEWGAVRIVPEPDPAAEVLITGKILRSDGDLLELFVRVTDASGSVWLEQSFAQTDEVRMPGDAGPPQFAALYEQIVSSMVAARDALEPRTVSNLRELSLLRYARQLAPAAFDEYLQENGDSTVSLLRLPARDDPMLNRIRQIRATDDVITDTVDARFRTLNDEIARVYAVWRDYRRKLVAYREGNARRAASTAGTATRGSYDALLNAYENYKYDRITEQEQDKLAIAFNNELSPKVAEMEANVDELQRWIDEKYELWNRLLEELFEVEQRINQGGA